MSPVPLPGASSSSLTNEGSNKVFATPGPGGLRERMQRAAALGLSVASSPGKDSNRSLPGILKDNDGLKSGRIARWNNRSKLTSGNDLDSLSFSTSLNPGELPSLESSMAENSDEPNVQGNNELNLQVHRAVFTMQCETTEILVVNDIACDLLQFSPEDLIGRKFEEIIAREHSQPTLPEMLLTSKNEHVVSNGRVVDVYAKDGSTVPVALWMTRLKSHTVDGSSRCIAVMEPVARIVATLKLSSDGRVLSCDKEAEALLGFCQNELLRMDIREVIPGLQLPSTLTDGSVDLNRRQELTGRMRGGFSFPLSIRLNWDNEGKELSATLWVFTCMSGLLIVKADGSIADCNSAFVQLAFGYRMNDLLEREIGSLVLELQATSMEEYFLEGGVRKGRGQHKDGTNLDLLFEVVNAKGSREDRQYFLWISCDLGPVIHSLDTSLALDLTSCSCSAPEESRRRRSNYGKRSDSLYVNLTGNSSYLVDLRRASVKKSVPKHNISVCENELMEGEYGDHYGSCRILGSGAFGYVLLGYRKTDSLLVVTKFIRKSKVHKSSWTTDENGKRIPLEVSLLQSFTHPNIVQVLDQYENEKFIQMVMEKHGSGMDLFAFIENHPHLDEPLASHIFRQIVSAIEYIHSHSIIHRDIKDENIIIDENFHVKLIDFGSAAKMDGQLFKVFCGTLEYCSPEVLEGNPYKGPELEIWSLGVTLYILVYEENPFDSIEETMKAEFDPPFEVSDSLTELLTGMLEKNIEKRYSIKHVVEHRWLHQTVDVSSYNFFDMVTELDGTLSKYYRDEDETSSGHHSVSEVSNVTALATSTPFRTSKATRGSVSNDSVLGVSEGVGRNLSGELDDLTDEFKVSSLTSADTHLPENLSACDFGEKDGASYLLLSSENSCDRDDSF